MSATFPGMFWIYRDDLLRQHEIDFGFVQENQAMSTERGGRARIAFPDPAGGRRPKLARGSILDVAVNIRRGSPDYGPAGSHCKDDEGQSARNLQQ